MKSRGAKPQSEEIDMSVPDMKGKWIGEARRQIANALDEAPKGSAQRPRLERALAFARGEEPPPAAGRVVRAEAPSPPWAPEHKDVARRVAALEAKQDERDEREEHESRPPPTIAEIRQLLEVAAEDEDSTEKEREAAKRALAALDEERREKDKGAAAIGRAFDRVTPGSTSRSAKRQLDAIRGR
jgi:hypothetical protein